MAAAAAASNPSDDDDDDDECLYDVSTTIAIHRAGG